MDYIEQLLTEIDNNDVELEKTMVEFKESCLYLKEVISRLPDKKD